jgi:hypothetical protein
MSAWKLRAWVYGMLAVVAALVLWQSGAIAGEPPDPRRLTGVTSQGSSIDLYVRDGDLVSLRTRQLYSRCGDRKSFVGPADWAVIWFPSANQSNVSYRRDGHAFTLHERPLPHFVYTYRSHMNLYMSARFTHGGDGVAGRIWYSGDPGGVHCESGPIGFSAHP